MSPATPQCLLQWTVLSQRPWVFYAQTERVCELLLLKGLIKNERNRASRRWNDGRSISDSEPWTKDVAKIVLAIERVAGSLERAHVSSERIKVHLGGRVCVPQRMFYMRRTGRAARRVPDGVCRRTKTVSVNKLVSVGAVTNGPPVTLFPRLHIVPAKLRESRWLRGTNGLVASRVPAVFTKGCYWSWSVTRHCRHSRSRDAFYWIINPDDARQLFIAILDDFAEFGWDGFFFCLWVLGIQGIMFSLFLPFVVRFSRWNI